jgi:hypothetical protein
VAFQTFAGTSSPNIWATCPSGSYTFIFYFVTPTSQPNYVLDQLDGVTDELQATGNPTHLIVNNNNEDKLDPICGTEMQLEFKSNDTINLNKFLRGNYSDRRYRITSKINDRVFFRGYMQLAGTQEPFMPHPNAIRLSFTDQLGSLKNKPMVDASGNNPTLYNKIIKYIAWCLRLTGIEQNINVVMNIRGEDDGTIAAEPDKHFYNTQFLDAKTFEAEVGESEDAYTVLSKILKHTCRIAMRHGEWWIKNTDEFDNQPDYVAVFDSTGEFIEMKEGATYEKEVSLANDMSWMQHSSIVGFGSPSKFGKLTFRYENPKEVPCNIDLERGDYISDIDSTHKKFNLNCWDKLRQSGTGDVAALADIFIEREYNANGYEVTRFVVFQGSVGNFIMSEQIPVKAKDKLRFAMSRRMSADVSGSGFYRDTGMQIRLYAKDGTFWNLQGENSSGDGLMWVQCDANFTTNQRFIWIEGDAADDQTQAVSTYGSDESPEIPREGYIRLCAHQSHMTTGDWPGKDTYIDKVTFEYLPYINGSYEKYTGQYHKVSQSPENPESVDDQVYFSDSPVRIVKGALHKYNGSDYELSGLFWNASVFIGGPPDPTYLHPYAYLQVFNLWNQIRPINRILRGQIRGIESDSVDALDRCDLPTVFHTYRLRDIDEHTNDKKFMLLGYEMDLRLCRFSQTTVREVHDEIVGKKYDDSYEFKYVTK